MLTKVDLEYFQHNLLDRRVQIEKTLEAHR